MSSYIKWGNSLLIGSKWGIRVLGLSLDGDGLAFEPMNTGINKFPTEQGEGVLQNGAAGVHVRLITPEYPGIGGIQK